MVDANAIQNAAARIANGERAVQLGSGASISYLRLLDEGEHQLASMDVADMLEYGLDSLEGRIADGEATPAQIVAALKVLARLEAMFGADLLAIRANGALPMARVGA